MARILVIGGLGYCGSYLADGLKQDGHTIHIADTLAGSCRDYRELSSSVLNSYDAILWFAGASSVAMAVDDPWEALDSNFLGLLQLRNKLAIPTYLIYASSASVYSQALPASGMPQATEDDPIHPRANPYDRSKFLVDYANQGGWMPNSLGLRMGTVCGWNTPLRVDTIFNKMSLDALEAGEIQVSGREAWRSLLFLEDLLTLVRGCLEKRPTGVLNAYSYNGTIGSIADTLGLAYSVPVISHHGFPAYNFRLDPTEMRRVARIPARSLSEQCELFREAWEGAGGRYEVSWPPSLDLPRVCPVGA